MKKINLGYLAVFIVFVLFNVIAFAIPVQHNLTFWILYSFTDIAILSQIFIWHWAFDGRESMKSKFYGIPVANVGTTYLILQFIIFARCITIPNFPDWLALILCFGLFALTMLGIIGAEVAREEIERVEEKVKTKVMFIKNIQLDVELLKDKELNPEIKSALEKLAENIRYSDPMSDESLYELEDKIKNEINNLENSDDKLSAISNIDNLIKERNKRCKLLK